MKVCDNCGVKSTDNNSVTSECMSICEIKDDGGREELVSQTGEFCSSCHDALAEAMEAEWLKFIVKPTA